MNNPYYLEQLMIEREHEIDEGLAHSALISQQHGTPRLTGGSHRRPMRARLGLYLVCLGTRLAA